MAQTETAWSEWRAHWPVVVAAMLGFSFASLAPASLGLFIEPLSAQFGWKRAQIALGLTLYAVFAVPLSPLAGALVDRRGSRGIAIAGMALTICAFAGFSLANGSVSQWLGLWLFYAIVALLIKSTVWTAAVSRLFSASRGLSLAVVFCGTAISQTLAPLLARWLIDDYGWRNAFLSLAIGWGGIAFILVVFFFFDTRGRGDEKRLHAEKSSIVRPVLEGLSFKEALQSAPLRKVALATVLTCTLMGGLILHQVPILAERGLSRETAAFLAASAGFASLFGKLCTGWLYDRSQSGWIGGVSLCLPALACSLLLQRSPSFALLVCGMLVVGYASGAQLQLTTYLTSRYAGLRHFGKIFGVMASLMAFGVGVGPVIAGSVFDHFGSYALLLRSGIPVGLLCGALVARLGPYPEFRES